MPADQGAPGADPLKDRSDDVGAEVGEDLARPRPSENAGEFEYAQANERTGVSSERTGGAAGRLPMAPPVCGGAGCVTRRGGFVQTRAFRVVGRCDFRLRAVTAARLD
jgi:hypothetical protein